MAMTGSHQIERLQVSKDTVGPLLRSPFNGGRRGVLSKVKSDYFESPNLLPQHGVVRDLILGARIGGNFWQYVGKLPTAARQIVVVPTDIARARLLLANVIERISVESILIVFPVCDALKPFLRQAIEMGASIAPSKDPYSILDIALNVYADEQTDIGSLAAMAGIASFQLEGSIFRRILAQDILTRVANGTCYINPYTAAPAAVEEIVEILGDWRRMFSRNRAISVCAGVSLWKRRQVKRLLYNGEYSPPFRRSVGAVLSHAAPVGRAVGVWTTRMPSTLEAKAEGKEIQLVRMEDGFIRSFGLGSALTAPASITADLNGIYFDPSKPSDLEMLLANTIFSETMKQRAKRLIGLLNANSVSKYSCGGEAPRIEAKPEQRIILVPGQVADDLSLRLGARSPVVTNLALLTEVRRRNPDAFIVYRPHPDVEAGYRRGAISKSISSGIADQVTAGGSIAALMSVVDEVHTMTSLAGFEALVRGRKVETYGQPFYAGWGLTKDHAPLERRQRQLQLDELVAAALILYPNYIDPVTGILCGPETLIGRLAQPELWQPNMLMRLRHFYGKTRLLWGSTTQKWSRYNA